MKPSKSIFSLQLAVKLSQLKWAKTNCRQEGKCIWHALAQIEFFSLCSPPFNNSLSWLGETPFLTPDKSCDKAIKWILCGWLRLTGPVWEMADPPNCQKRSLLSACLQLPHSFTWEGINLSDGCESVIETGRYVLNGQHRLHFNKIFYLWNKWPICAFGISPIKQLFGWLAKFINM